MVRNSGGQFICSAMERQTAKIIQALQMAASAQTGSRTRLEQAGLLVHHFLPQRISQHTATIKHGSQERWYGTILVVNDEQAIVND